MKFIKKIMMVLISLFVLVPVTRVNAADALIDIYTSDKTPVVGSTITVTVYVKASKGIGSYEYTLDYDNKKLKLVSGVLSNAGYSEDGKATSLKDTFKFKVIATGSSKVSARAFNVWNWAEKTYSTAVDPASITGVTASSSSSTTTTYSTNNYLSKLEVEGQKIKFNKNTLEYKLNLDPSVEEINIKATREDSTATINGTGKRKVSEGENKFNVVVTSEKGTKRTYTLIVTIEDKNPIKTIINDLEYTVIKRKSAIEKLENYVEKEITINNQKIPALYSEITKYTLVGLKDKNGNINLYVYDESNNSYRLYKEYQFNNLKISPLAPEKVIDGYKETTITINDEKVVGYKIDDSSNYALIYGINTETGEKSWYSYEKTENTMQKYYSGNNGNSKIEERLTNAKKLVLGLAVLSTVSVILLIVVATTKVVAKPKNVKSIKNDQGVKELSKKDTKKFDDLQQEKKKKKNKKNKEKTILDE